MGIEWMKPICLIVYNHNWHSRYSMKNALSSREQIHILTPTQHLLPQHFILMKAAIIMKHSKPSKYTVKSLVTPPEGLRDIVQEKWNRCLGIVRVRVISPKIGIDTGSNSREQNRDKETPFNWPLC